MLPETGYVRVWQIVGCSRRGIAPVIPVCKASWWAGVAEGRYPAGVLLGPRTRAWAVGDIRKLIAEMGVGE